MAVVELFCAVLGFAILALLFYHYFIRPLKFWEKCGVEGPKPMPFFGNLFDVMFLRKSIHEYARDIYHRFPNEKIVGIYMRSNPVLVLRDLDLISDVLIKNFPNFADRGLDYNEKVDPLSAHLFMIEPRRWRPLRYQLNPCLTSGKLKDMYFFIQECSEQFCEILGKLVDEGKDIIDVRDLSDIYTTDVTASCAFGLNPNSLTKENSEFRRMGKRAFRRDLFTIIKSCTWDMFPRLYGLLKPLFYDDELNNFFINSVKQTMECRDRENVTRNDFIDILRELKRTFSKLGNDIELSDALCAAQAFIFFIAGYETSSLTIGHALYELAQNHSIQDKLREEIAEFSKNSDFSHESLKNMTYMHQVFQETLRKYPLVTMMRRSMGPYTFAGTNVTIPEKMPIFIPVLSIHWDPNIFPDPDVFDPERFNDEAISKRHEMAFLGFGNGPRNCIGRSFAAIQVKLALFKMLQNYRVDVCEKTMIPYAYSPASNMFLTPKEGIILKVTRLNVAESVNPKIIVEQTC